MHRAGQNHRMRIRAARTGDLTRLQDIERAAGEPFRAIGMTEIADDEPPSLDLLTEYVEAGRAWVATLAGGGDVPVAYLIADLVDGNLHIEQVSVDPAHARQGIGRRLIEHAADYARDAGMPALTLTTFVDVPWNAPYYRRCGFVDLDGGTLTDGLRAVRDHETAIGLDRWPRVCMRRDLTH
ncbi:GCN5 family N-acetyltransferase [Actinoplanes campanulatus]|nr:GCN5 family N-acetyltransferase [Actinoplanes campanulatus]GID35886.1 GCN5 family N-acetyltransferase [Actinoplanes campanulatus]